jgi:tetratricopeptide (TPR) repeat protein
MLRLAICIAVVLLAASVSAQVLTGPEKSPAQPDSSTPSQQEPQPTQEKPAKKQPNKAVRKLGEALPDCVNLIFIHSCHPNAARQEEMDRQQLQKYDEAAERCKQLTSALPPKFYSKRSPASAPETDSGYSSSKHSEEAVPYCTPEDVIAADHDTDVGDFNFNDKNYRGAAMRYQSALDRLPGEPTASLHLARTLDRMGDKPGAIEQYENYLAWSPTGKDADQAKAALDRLQKELALK